MTDNTEQKMANTNAEVIALKEAIRLLEWAAKDFEKHKISNDNWRSEYELLLQDMSYGSIRKEETGKRVADGGERLDFESQDTQTALKEVRKILEIYMTSDFESPLFDKAHKALATLDRIIEGE